ncbi:sulfate adenylyltransferase [Monoraphidium neglectum]|uniref:Sulfate adenylyltransferase n=1 Tax=Monoraphidium neglectum TaxID=145388 RepID=A0A0D2KKC2_9CHLO|nr:sulfate adenylyltransferase [Monoraphidium neglectum]KIY96243.1 sulfate adenylyltransferase [Monoraphidium neglectum]|eukprot:XP_013895263.1 sulfate adenylyltransferase [Monoraphidium neglectum]
MASTLAAAGARSVVVRAARDSMRVAVPAPVCAVRAQPRGMAARQQSAEGRRGLAVTRLASVAEAKPAALTAEGLQAPHGGKLVNLLVPAEEQAALVASTTTTLELSDRNACDVELLTVGAFSPLEHFMSQEEYDSVVRDMRLPNGLLFGLPIVLDTDREDLKLGDKQPARYGRCRIIVPWF